MDKFTTISFFCSLLTEIHVPYMILQSSDDLIAWFSVFLNPSDSNTVAITEFKEFSSIYRAKTIYRIQNFCEYFLLFRIPDSQNITYFAIGPYMLSRISAIDQFVVPGDQDNTVSVLDDEKILLRMVNAFTKYLFDITNAFPLKDIKIPETSNVVSAPEILSCKTLKYDVCNTHMLAEYYRNETELLKIVRHGQWNDAQTLLDTAFNIRNYVHLHPWETSFEFIRNQSIDLNTLLRKTAEFAGVSPIHIETLSSQFILKINRLRTGISTEKEVLYLRQEIIRKYCQLIQTHSLKGYSPVVQKVLTNISSDISGDLTLNGQAKLTNVSPSYLSMLFKKETGTTLTEYVTQKRIKHAIFLLANTDMQIQCIAQCCGIADVNYFTKIFKKHTGKTPKEYQCEIRRSEVQADFQR